MFIIFAEAHKIIGMEMKNNISDIYGVNLDEKNLLWGSVLPDVMPKYKLIRHYEEESIDFITGEISNIIYHYRKLDVDNLSKTDMKILSRKLGIVSHYISDYTCIPHAKRWTFFDSMMKHIKYEAKLNDVAISHDFKRNRIYSNDLDIYETNIKEIRKNVKLYIKDVVKEEYSIKEDYSNDLDFALSLNLKLLYYVLDSIKVYETSTEKKFVFQI